MNEGEYQWLWSWSDLLYCLDHGRPLALYVPCMTACDTVVLTSTEGRGGN